MEPILDDFEQKPVYFNYADVLQRFIAALIDGVVLAVAYFLIGIILSDSWNSAITVVLSAMYEAYFLSSDKMATPGKQLLGIKVVGGDGDRISFGRGMGRHFSKYISSFILCIGYIMAAFTKRHQALHDIICDTIVVNK